jgi:hypothetical protein
MLLRLLLAQAMDGAEAPNQFDAVDPDDLVFGKMLLEDRERFAVGFWGPISRDEQCAVHEIKVHVGSREALAVVRYWLGHRDFYYLERAAILIP